MGKHTKSPFRGKHRWITWTIIYTVLLFCIICACYFVFQYSIKKGVKAATSSFYDNYSTTMDDTYTQFHDIAFHISEEANHVSNDVIITISSVKEKGDLEVLQVSDVVYMISDSKDSKSGTTCWLEVSGTGVFTVNLSAAEYVVDNARHSVLVRIPSPELNANRIRIDNYEELLFKENVWNRNNSVYSGDSLSFDLLNEAKGRIQEDFEANEQYYKFAKQSAESMISALIKSINPDVKDIEVKVEVY